MLTRNWIEPRLYYETYARHFDLPFVDLIRDPPDRAILVVTHYQRLLNYIVPDRVHVLVDGRIVRSGGPELALELEDKGYTTGNEARSATATPA